jgi:hypothetical protein
MRNYKLDTKLLPKIWVYWETKRDNKSHYLNCHTGKEKCVPEDWMRSAFNTNGTVPFGYTWGSRDSDKLWIGANSNMHYLYTKYHKDIDMLEMAVVKIDTSRKQVARTWEFAGERYFLSKDKKFYDINGNLYTRYYQPDECHWAYSGKDLLRVLLNFKNNSQILVSEFKKFIGANYFLIGNGSSVTIESYWHMQKWYESVQKQRGKGKQQKLVDKLVAMPLKSTDGLAEKYQPKKTGDSWCPVIKSFVYFERVNDEWSVLRAFVRNNNNITEAWRAYISKNIIRIMVKSEENWIPATRPISWWSERFYFANAEEAKQGCNQIRYTLDAINENPDDKVCINNLLTALRFPEVEQLMKFGFEDVATRVMRSHTPKAEIKYAFGGYYNEKKPNLLQKIGLTKPQLDKILEICSNNWHISSTMTYMRRMFEDDLSSMDINSFEKYLRCCKEMNERRLDVGYLTRLNIDSKKFFRNLCRIGQKYPSAYGIAADLLSDYRYLYNDRPEIDWYFDGFSDLTRAHDAIGEIKRRRDEERRAMWDKQAAERLKKQEEKRKEIDENRKQYEYEEDEYVIRLPKDLNELVTEGNRQHICIGGYTSSHALGNTNLFFLRKKECPDMPFYAIEMNNDKKIIQIHGFGNKWLGNDPEAIPTVIRWLRKHGISCTDAILTCKSHGYCAVNEYVPMPIVD